MLRRVVGILADREIDMLTASLAFTTVLSIIPLFAVSLSVFHWLGGFDHLLVKFESFVLDNLAHGAGRQVISHLRQSIERVHSGTIGIGGAIALVFASTKLFYDIDRAIQRMFQAKAKKNLWLRVMIYWIILFIAPVGVAAVLAWQSKQVSPNLRLSGQNAFLALFFIGTLLFYRFVPSVKVGWKSVVPSAILALIAVALAQAFFGTIAKKILNINKIYGGLASIPLFLIWVQIFWYIFLSGAALTQTLQSRSSRR